MGQSLFQRILRAPVRIPRKLAAWSAMAAFLSSPGQTLWRQHLARRRAREAAGVALPPSACVAHVYYIDLLPEILACWRTLPSGAPLFITVPDERAEALAEALSAALSAEESTHVRIVPSLNRGRDIAPFMDLLGSGALDGFDAVLKIHTKKSPHLMDGVLRRRLIFALLAGNPDQTALVIGLFRKADVGMVGSRWSFRKRPAMWMANRERITALARLMQPEASPSLGFFEGSMFWVRPSALQPLRSLQLTRENFEGEAGQLDGTLHHAIERMFTISTWTAGRQVHDLRGGILYPRS